MSASNGAISLTGRWHGRYTYLDGGEGESFICDLIELGDSLTGTTFEVSDFGDDHQGRRSATITGSRNGAHVSFVKHYVPGHGHEQPIYYTGDVNDDATEIDGTWLISRLAFGRFLMIRGTALPEPVKVEETARA